MTEKIKDIFDFIKNPQKEEYRVECCIDKLYDINKYNGLTNFTGNKIEIKKFLINDAIMNYKNEILYIKIQYMIALNYYNQLTNLEKDSEEYSNTEFLSVLYFNHVVINLYSAYDKTYHILNAIYELNVDYKVEKTNYKKSIRDKIKANVSDKKIGEKVNSIYSRLQQEQYLELRDNIVHNKSDSFYKIEKDYSQTLDSLYGEKQIPIDELINRIDKICSIISEQIEIINDFFRMKLNRRKE